VKISSVLLVPIRNYGLKNRVFFVKAVEAGVFLSQKHVSRNKLSRPEE